MVRERLLIRNPTLAPDTICSYEYIADAESPLDRGRPARIRGPAVQRTALAGGPMGREEDFPQFCGHPLNV